MTTSKSDNETYADVLDCAAKLLAWKAARRRVRDGGEIPQILLRSAAECVLLADEYRSKKP